MMKIQKFSWRGGQRYLVRVRVRRTVERARRPEGEEVEERVEAILGVVVVDGCAKFIRSWFSSSVSWAACLYFLFADATNV